MSVDTEIIPFEDQRLGRHKVHDERSRAFSMGVVVNRLTWRDKAVRIYDPLPNPRQCHGECTAVAKASQLNAVGNRVKGHVLNMNDVHSLYTRNTQIDEFPWTWPPTDQGSSGLASAKAAQALGYGGAYHWFFGGGDELVQGIMDGKVISMGSYWYWDMFGPSLGTYAGLPVVRATGGRSGGHQYVFRGFDVDKKYLLGRCWWGPFRDFWLPLDQADFLKRDGGDAHWQARV